jgi:hypothetical protein
MTLWAMIVCCCQASRLAQFQIMLGSKPPWPAVSSCNWSSPLALGSVLCLCSDSQARGLSLIRESGAIDHQALCCPTSWLLKILCGVMPVLLPLMDISLPDIVAKCPKIPWAVIDCFFQVPRAAQSQTLLAVDLTFGSSGNLSSWLGAMFSKWSSGNVTCSSQVWTECWKPNPLSPQLLAK